MKIRNLPINRHGLVLAGFALLVTSALSMTQCFTRQLISDNENAHRQKSLTEVLPSQWFDHPLDQHTLQLVDDNTNQVRTCYIAKLQGKPVAVIISAVATDGYSGDIEMLVGILADGTITGVRVTKHTETPGLGDAIDLPRSDWILGFNNKSLDKPLQSRWTVKKQNGDFDQFTGATITPRAVVHEVKNTLLFFHSMKQHLLES